MLRSCRLPNCLIIFLPSVELLARLTARSFSTSPTCWSFMCDFFIHFL